MKGLSFILFILLVPLSLAQQGYYREDERYYDDRYQQQQRYDDRGYDGGGGPDGDDDNLYANYAARKNEKTLGAGGRGGVGWIKIVAAGVGGYFVGSTIESRKRKGIPKLRFKVKQRVQCKVDTGNGHEWRTGTVVKLWHQEKKMPGQWMAYQVRLDDGTIIYAPNDTDMIIRKA